MVVEILQITTEQARRQLSVALEFARNLLSPSSRLAKQQTGELAVSLMRARSGQIPSKLSLSKDIENRPCWWWLVACSAPRHYLYQFSLIVMWNHGTKFQRNFKTKTKVFNKQNVVYKMPAICFDLNMSIKSSSHGQNGRHFADDIFICIFATKKFCILIKMSLKFVPRGPIHNKSTLVSITAWRRIGTKPLSEPMANQFTDAFMRY